MTLLPFQELQIIVISSLKNILIIPGLNQSRNVFSPFDQISNTTYFELTCNSKPLQSDLNFLFLKNELIQFLEKNHFDYIICHSLGSLVLCDLLQLKGVNFLKNSKIVMIAPCFKNNFLDRIIEFVPAQLWLLSFNKKKYRVHDFLPIAFYHEVVKLQKQVMSNFSSLKNILNSNNVIIYYDFLDELVNTEIFEKFSRAYPYREANFPKHLYRNLIVDLSKKIEKGLF